MKSTLIVILFLFFGISPLMAQNTISGKVRDKTKAPLPFANILLHQKDSTGNPKGVVSDGDGNYLFENIKNGNYSLEVSTLGFKNKKSEPFELSANKILDFTLEEESKLLDELIITSKRPVITQTAEKLVVDLEKSEMINTSLQDVMRKIPGILVTNNGISIAGNRGVRILINGKTTEYMDVQTLLSDFPADNIAQIEVVEQPGAEYQASGSGAIINIILKKNVRLGTHGSVNAWVGEDQGFEYGTGASISSYKNKVNWQARINHSQPTYRDDLFLIRTVGDETYDQTTIEPYDPNNLTLSGNIDYYLSDKHSVGIGGRWNNRKSQRIGTSKTIISDADVTNTLFSENSFDKDRVNFNFNPYYEYKSEKDKLIIDFNYVDFTNDDTNTLSTAAGSTINQAGRRLFQKGKYNIKTYKADYIKTFSDNFKLSLGTRYADVNTNNDLQSLLENGSGIFELQDTLSSQFLIEETIFALYSKINATAGKWSFSGGLRYEDSNTVGTSFFIQGDSTQTRPIQKIFPSASVSRKISDVLSANVSYSYRIQRPSYSSLNSFTTYLDFWSAGEGNPKLAPSYTNNYQFNLTYEGQPFFTVGYSKTDDVIFQLIRQDNETKQIRQQEVNVENNRNWNFRLFGPLSFIKGVEGYTGFIVTNTDYQSSTYEINLNQWNLYWFIQASYQLPWDINFELSGNYGTGALEGQIEVDWLAEMEFSLGKKFMKDKLKVNLGFNKMLNRGFVGNIDYGNNVAQVESNGSRQNIQLRATYSFGSKFGKKKTRRSSDRSEENRIQSNN